MNKLTKLALAFILLGSVSAPAAITISSNNSGGAGRTIFTSTGTALVTGSIRVGYFANPTNSDSVMRGSDFAALNAAFIPLGELADANGGDVTSPASSTGNLPIQMGATAGKYVGTISGVKNAYVASGTRLFLLVSNSSDPKTTAPTEWALVSDAAWLAPVDDVNLGGSITMALNTTNIDNASADVWRGSIATGTGNPLTLAAVPEPAVSALFLLGAVVGFRRRR